MSKNEPVAVGGCVRMGGDCLKYLKRGWNKKEGRGNKDFEKVGGASWVKGLVP